MKCQQIIEALENLSEDSIRRMDDKDIDYLADKGLLEKIDSYEFRKQNEDYLVLSSLRDTETKLIGELDKIQVELADVSRKMGGWIYKRKHKEYSNQYMIDSSHKLTVERGIERKKGDLEHIRKRIKTGESQKENQGLFIRVFGGSSYVKATDLGDFRIRQFSIRDPDFLQSTDYEVFEEDFLPIQDRYNRFSDAYDFLTTKKGFDTDNTEVSDFTVAFSNFSGEFESIYARVDTIDRFLISQMDCSKDDTERLITISMLMDMGRDLHDNLNELKKVYQIMRDDGHSDSYGTLSEAAGIIRIKGVNAQAKYDRFNKIRDELNKRQWSSGSSATCYVAANLGQMTGDEEALAEEFREQEKVIEAKTNDSNVQTGLAALMLMDASGSREAKADRFYTAYKLMTNKYNFDDDSDNYAPAAVISLMPGDLEENIQWLRDTVELFKDDGGSESKSVNRALDVIGAQFDDILRYQRPRRRSSYRSSSYSSSSSSFSPFNFFGF